MSDYYEIEFHSVDSKRSGDAITMRYQLDGETTIHVVDGGFQNTGEKLSTHIQNHYDNPKYINHVVVTHNDADHAGGLRSIIENFKVGELWMLRPWEYAEELLPRFSRYTNAENLRRRLREIYSNLAALEDIAIENGVAIRAPFQGTKIGQFTVLAPSEDRFKDLVVASEKTPIAVAEAALMDGRGLLGVAFEKLGKFIRALWGDEKLSSEDTSAENEMSVVQYAHLIQHKVLLTGDVGREGLAEARDFAPNAGLTLPGIGIFQIPHHGSRRNVSSDLLNEWLGPKLDSPPEEGAHKFRTIVCASKEDPDHPRKAVIRAMKHRGAKVFSTEEYDWVRFYGGSAPQRAGMQPAKDLPYPEEQEE